MKKAIFPLLACLLWLTACTPTQRAAPIVAPGVDTTISPLPGTAIPPTLESTAIPPVTEQDLGIVGSDMVKAFQGIEKYAQKESDGSYSVTIGGEKYTLQGGWNLNAELNNAYAPATVNAVDKDGRQVMLIWNTEGLSINSPLSVDIENPTDFSDLDKLTTLQRFLLQNPDPFIKRTRALTVRYELTESGRVIFLRTDAPGENNSKPSNVWLRYKAPKGKVYWVNPTDTNDVRDRKVIMCAYGQNATKDQLQRNRLDGVLHKLGDKIIWPILKAGSSFFNNFLLETNIGGTDYRDLYDLSNLPGNMPEKLENLGRIINRNDVVLVNIGDNTGTPLTGNDYEISLDSAIQEMVIPCDIK